MAETNSPKTDQEAPSADLVTEGLRDPDNIDAVTPEELRGYLAEIGNQLRGLRAEVSAVLDVAEKVGALADELAPVMAQLAPLAGALGGGAGGLLGGLGAGASPAGGGWG